MKSSLITERPLLVSPTLAATIGLEEAVMLQALSEYSALNFAQKKLDNNELNTFTFTNEQMEAVFPFWAENEIIRVRDSLAAIGVITIHKGRTDKEFVIEINGPSAARTDIPPVKKSSDNVPRSASVISENWQPEENWIRLCKQHSIPEKFVRGLIPEFVNYWRDRGQSRFSWGNAFYKHVIREWREEQTRNGKNDLLTTMSSQWKPSPDAIEILEKSGIAYSFIEDAIPEFVLYWRERGISHGAWNTKFVEHIRRQWAKFEASFNLDDTPRVISDDWQPSEDCYEILGLAEIDEQYARNRVPEFIMYWKDSQQVRSSWNTVFLQYIKQNWARQLKQSQSTETPYAENQFINRSSEHKIKERFRQYSDRSWAE